MAKRAIGVSPLTVQAAAVDSMLAPKPKGGKRLPTGRKVGRPPGGLKPGERVSDYVRKSLWLPPETNRQLDALSRLLGRPEWAVVVDALAALEKALSAGERQALQRLKPRG